jgi:hypothetical protein
MSAACIGLLSRHDEGLRLDALVAALVRALDDADRLDDDLLAAAAHEGELDVLAAGLARRSTGTASARPWPGDAQRSSQRPHTPRQRAVRRRSGTAGGAGGFVRDAHVL